MTRVLRARLGLLHSFTIASSPDSLYGSLVCETNSGVHAIQRLVVTRIDNARSAFYQGDNISAQVDEG